MVSINFAGNPTLEALARAWSCFVLKLPRKCVHVVAIDLLPSIDLVLACGALQSVVALGCSRSVPTSHICIRSVAPPHQRHSPTTHRTSSRHSFTATIDSGLLDHLRDQKIHTAVMRTWQTSTRAWSN